jgi:Antimicrobial peptide resistance and lipid A acylation protein PagP
MSRGLTNTMKRSLLNRAFVVAISTAGSHPALSHAACDYSWNWVAQACQRVANVASNGSWDGFVTGYGWHIDGYTNYSQLNAYSWGGGVGKHLTDANGNDDLLFAMVFSDSHKSPEPIGGFARQWFTRPVLGGWSLGGGYLAGVTAREDIAHYAPVPVVLPVVSVRYRVVSLMGTVIPRIPGINKGDVAFFFGRVEF